MDKPPIFAFKGPYRFLSNFWPAEVEWEGMKFTSVEHGYVAAKTTDIEIRKEIQKIEKPGDVKRFGRKIKLRPDWEEIKLMVMETLVSQKFINHPELRKLLLATNGRLLIEGNSWHDLYYGQCTCPKCNGAGENHLGRVLMKVRESL